jgi:hypothetical protein
VVGRARPATNKHIRLSSSFLENLTLGG